MLEIALHLKQSFTENKKYTFEDYKFTLTISTVYTTFYGYFTNGYA